jgi:hypothetical protein
LFALTQGGDTVPLKDPNQPPPNFAQLAIFENGKWRRVSGPSNGVQFTDVAAFAANDVYMSASDGLYHYDGTAITAVAQVRENLRSVAVSPPGSPGKFIIAGTNNGAAWIGTAASMTRVATNTTGQLDGVCINAANEAFAMNKSSGGLFRYDGSAWTAVPAPTTTSRTDLPCLGPGTAFVFAQNPGQGLGMLKWNGSGWTSAAGPGAQSRSLQCAVV